MFMSDDTPKASDKLREQIEKAGLVESVTVGDTTTKLGSLSDRLNFLKDLESDEGRETGTRPMFCKVTTGRILD